MFNLKHFFRKPLSVTPFNGSAASIGLIGSTDRQLVERAQREPFTLTGENMGAYAIRHASSAGEYERMRRTIGRALSVGGGLLMDYYTVLEREGMEFRLENLYRERSLFMIAPTVKQLKTVRREFKRGGKPDNNARLIPVAGLHVELQGVSLLQAVAWADGEPLYVSGFTWVERQ